VVNKGVLKNKFRGERFGMTKKIDAENTNLRTILNKKDEMGI